MFIEILQNSQENTFARVSFLIKLQDWDLQLYLKRQFGLGVFLCLVPKYSARISHRGCSVRKDVHRNFAKLTGKHLCQSIFLNKVAGLGPATLFKKTIWLRCFLLKSAKFLRTPFLHYWVIASELLILAVPVRQVSQKKIKLSREFNILSFLFMLYSAVFVNTGFLDKLFLLIEGIFLQFQI